MTKGSYWRNVHDGREVMIHECKGGVVEFLIVSVSRRFRQRRCTLRVVQFLARYEPHLESSLSI